MGKIPELTDCNPGFTPTEYNVVLAPEEFEAVSKGGIILADTTKEREELATVRGRLVSVSPLAFTYHDAHGAALRSAWPIGKCPKAGDAVVFSKYAGILIEGEDGREYRLCKDKDVAAIIG